MGLLERWNRFALKKIKINEHIDISVGRFIFGIGVFLLAEFTTFPLSWIFILFGVRIHKNNKKDEEVI